MQPDQRFLVLRPARHTWVIASVHGEAERLRALHDVLSQRIGVVDNLIYLGNLIGRGGGVLACIDEALVFRRALLAQRGADSNSVVYLRGGQEEMWHKLLQLQFASDPSDVLKWMMAQGVAATLEAYGGIYSIGIDAARQGATAISNWTTELRNTLRRHDGHNAFLGALRRAALAENRQVLYVNAGLDPERPLTKQHDSFWWGAAGFDHIEAPFDTFTRIVRGFDPRHRGFCDNSETLTIDGGCGFGGPLIAACLDPKGKVIDRIEC